MNKKTIIACLLSVLYFGLIPNAMAQSSKKAPLGLLSPEMNSFKLFLEPVGSKAGVDPMTDSKVMVDIYKGMIVHPTGKFPILVYNPKGKVVNPTVVFVTESPTGDVYLTKSLVTTNGYLIDKKAVEALAKTHIENTR